MDFQMLLRVVEQACANAHLVVVALEYVEMAASFAAFPEFGVVGKFGERHRTEAEFVVHLHHCGTRGDGEDLCIREEPSGKEEGLLLDAFRNAHTAECVGNDESGIGHETFPAPGFNIGETGETTILGNGYHSLSGPYFFADVLRSSLGYARLAFQGAAVDFIADFLCESCVALFCHHYIDFHHVNTLKTMQFNYICGEIKELKLHGCKIDTMTLI